jgi:hypothetical protein
MAQSNNTTTETPKLTLSTTIKVDQQIEKEIELPFFYKSKYGRLCMITEENKLIQVAYYKDHSFSISVSNELSKYDYEDIAAELPCTEHAFSTMLNLVNSIIQTQIQNL